LRNQACAPSSRRGRLDAKSGRTAGFAQQGKSGPMLA
jgi:hypothetical protein